MHRDKDVTYSENKKQPSQPSAKSGGLSGLQYILIGMVISLIIIIGLNVLRSGGRQNNSSESVPVTTQPIAATQAAATPTPTSSPTATPTPSPTPTPVPSPTATPEPTPVTSSVPADTAVVKYNSDGKIKTKIDVINGETVTWNYCYDAAGNYLYRTRTVYNAGIASADKIMPNAGINYWELSDTMTNCIGFTINYEITQLISGSGLGTRYVNILDDKGVWHYDVAEFEFDSLVKVSTEVSLDTPVNITGFSVTRYQPPDVSSYTVNQSMTDITLVSYQY